MFNVQFFPKKLGAADRRIRGQKPPLKPQEIWTIRVHLQMNGRLRDLALFNLALDSKLRACDLVRLRVHDVCQSGQVASRASVIQKKTKRPVQFEITERTRAAVSKWIEHKSLPPENYLFPSRIRRSPHLSTRQYARILASWLPKSGSIRAPTALIH